jgi:hypothetical protein
MVDNSLTTTPARIDAPLLDGSVTTPTIPNPQQFIKYPKNILAWRRHLPSNAWNILTILVDKTYGWDKTSDAVSISQIEAETTLKRSNIRRALLDLQIEDGPVEVIARGPRGIAVYRIRPYDCAAGEQGHTCAADSHRAAGEHGSPSDCATGGTVETATVPPVSTTTDVTTVHLRECVSTLSIESTGQGAEVLVGTPTSKSTVEEDGLVVKTDSVLVDPASGCLGGTPTSQALFVDPKTGKTWFLGQEVDCLSTLMKITKGEAESILRDGDGLSFTTIRDLIKKTWDAAKDPKVKNRVAYILGVIRNHQAKPTSKPLPRSAAPLPLNQAQAAPTAPAKPVESIQTNDSNRAHRDHVLAKAFVEMGPGERATNKYTLMDFARHFKIEAGANRNYPGLRHVCAHLNDMRLRGLVCLDRDGMYTAVPGALEALQQPEAEPYGPTPAPPLPAVPEPATPAVTSEVVQEVSEVVSAPEPVPATLEERILAILASAGCRTRDQIIIDLGVYKWDAIRALNILTMQEKIIAFGCGIPSYRLAPKEMNV